MTDDSFIEQLNRARVLFEQAGKLSDEDLSLEVNAKIWALLKPASEQGILLSELLDRFDDLVAERNRRASTLESAVDEWSEIIGE